MSASLLPSETLSTGQKVTGGHTAGDELKARQLVPVVLFLLVIVPITVVLPLSYLWLFLPPYACSYRCASVAEWAVARCTHPEGSISGAKSVLNPLCLTHAQPSSVHAKPNILHGQKPNIFHSQSHWEFGQEGMVEGPGGGELLTSLKPGSREGKEGDALFLVGP